MQRFYSVFSEIAAALLILLFTYTAISKLNEQTIFRAVLLKSPWLGFSAEWMVWVLPVTELIAAALVFFPVTRLWGLWLSLGLMLAFTFYIAGMLLFSSNLPCSCGGVLRKMTWVQHLLFNVLFTLLPGISLWMYYRNKKLLQQTGIAEHLQKKVGKY